jgi:hypothetical protein
MPNPLGPDRDHTAKAAGSDPDAVDRGTTNDPAESDVNGADQATGPDEEVTESHHTAPTTADPATEVMAKAQRGQEAAPPRRPRGERRYTAPGFDAKETAVINAATEPATEAFEPGRPGADGTRPRTAMPQLIPPRLGAKLRPSTQRSWGWVLALILIILALTAVAVLGTVLFTRNNKKPKASQEDQVRNTIQTFDVAVQNGDLAKLRSITCGDIRNGYLNYDEHEWTDTYRQVAAAKQYPVVASIDQVVVNDGHAEANVTAFMAYAPRIRSTRSFDLQYRDDQWKICQSNTG